MISGGRPTLGVVITNYETWPLTMRCLERVLACRGRLDAVLVVDDASTTPAPAPLDPAVRLVVNPRNLGLVRSLNLGIRAVETDLVVVLDSDAYPLGDFAGAARTRFAADPALAVLGFATVDEAGRPTGSYEEEPDLWSLVLGQRLHALYARLRRGRQRPCVYSCAMALRRSAFLEVGGFDEEFDWLDLDLDFCMRARRAGWRVEHTAEIVAFHRGSGVPQATEERVFRHYRNRWRLLRKHGKIRRPGPVRALVRLRLAGEWLLLRLLAALGRRPDLAEKAAGRRRILRWFAESCR